MTLPSHVVVRDLAEVLAVVLGTPAPANATSMAYAEWSTTRIVSAAALIEGAFRRIGWESAYVGGGVLQFHLGGEGYQTGDIDMVVAEPTGQAIPRDTLDAVMRRMGGRPSSARHWIFGTAPDELLVEIPHHDIPVELDHIALPGGLILTMDSIEHVIAGRIIEYHNTGNTEHARQAIHALRALAGVLDRARLQRCIVAERVEQASKVVMALTDRPGEITVELLVYAHEMLHGRRKWCNLSDVRCGPSVRRR
jgi:hypothetical protein